MSKKKKKHPKLRNKREFASVLWCMAKHEYVPNFFSRAENYGKDGIGVK